MNTSANHPITRLRRGQRDKAPLSTDITATRRLSHHVPRRKPSKALQRHANDSPSGGVQSLMPSLIGIGILVCGVMAKMGFRGRASVAGVDLGTTNSVICVQMLAKGVGEIQCMVDPASRSPIVPSVVSFLEPHERKVGPSAKIATQLDPHPSHVIVGAAAKRRIDSHPHHTLYHAKRVLGRPASDAAVQTLQSEVEFAVVDDIESGEVVFSVPDAANDQPIVIPPHQVGAYVVYHLLQITKEFLGHDNIKSAVICVPAKFNEQQRRQTYRAFRDAGVTVARVLEEPTAAALAYGLHRKPNVDYILVYDFGGGTLDVSLLHVSDGFVDVMGSDGDDRLGGADFDAAVAHFLWNERGAETVVTRTAAGAHFLEEKLAAECPILQSTPLCTVSSIHTLSEQLKIDLSAVDDSTTAAKAVCLALPESAAPDLSLPEFCAALEPVTFTVTSPEFDATVQSLYDRSLTPLVRLLADYQIQHDSIDEIVMVGGATRMPRIRALVRQALPHAQLNTRIDPDITVAYGAASVID